MLPLAPPAIKVMTILLAGSIVLSPVHHTTPDQADGKKLPFIAGYKKGKDPLPQGTTPEQNYINIWNQLKKELGLK